MDTVTELLQQVRDHEVDVAVANLSITAERYTQMDFSLPYFASGCSTKRLEEARAFFADPKRQAPGQDREFAKMAEGITDCVSLREREGAAVAAYLNDAVGTR